MKKSLLYLVVFALLEGLLALHHEEDDGFEDDLHALESVMIQRGRRPKVNRIPEQDMIDEENERDMPMKPWNREDLELPNYGDPINFIKKHCREGKCNFSAPPRRAVAPLNLREYQQKKLRVLEQSLDRTRGKVKQVIRDPCERCRLAGKSRSCRACAAGDEAEANRPIQPWISIKDKSKKDKMKKMRKMKKGGNERNLHRIDRKLIVVKKDHDKVVEVNQINLRFDFDVRQLQAQQEKQGIVQGNTFHHRGHHEHNEHGRKKVKAQARPLNDEEEIERHLRKHFDQHLANLHQRIGKSKGKGSKLGQIRKLRALRHPSQRHNENEHRGRHPTEVDSEYPPNEEIPRKEKPRLDDPKHKQTLSQKIKKAWKSIKKTLSKWSKTLKNYLHDVAVRFGRESPKNQIAMLTVVGIIITLQVMVAIKCFKFSQEEGYESIPDEDDDEDDDKKVDRKRSIDLEKN